MLWITWGDSQEISPKEMQTATGLLCSLLGCADRVDQRWRGANEGSSEYEGSSKWDADSDWPVKVPGMKIICDHDKILLVCDLRGVWCPRCWNCGSVCVYKIFFKLFVSAWVDFIVALCVCDASMADRHSSSLITFFLLTFAKSMPHCDAWCP